jgi:dTMP kinase
MFISFEGIDFCGKSTQIKLLHQYLENRGNIVKIIREPGGTEISEQVRTILLSKKNNLMTLETEILLFSASRSQLVREKLRPYLDKGYYVISDRFHDSTTAYQGYGRGIPFDTVKHIHQISIGDTIPSITFLIDIPVDEAARRMGFISNTELDRIEVSKKTFFENVRNGYLEMARNEERFRVINGLLSIESIHEKIVTEIDNYEKGKI